MTTRDGGPTIPPQVDERLRSERIAWLTTVDRDGQPQSSPVWFLWDGSAFTTYSLDDTPRVRNIETNPRVALHLSDDGLGSRIVTFEGRAHLDPDAGSAVEMPAYIAKYRDEIDGYGWTQDSFARDYPVAIRIEPTRLRAW
jgi:PPOX class probable F420-dependent enzyme